MSDALPHGEAHAEHGPQESGSVHASVRYEARDAHRWLVLGTLAGLALMIVICAAVSWVLYARWTAQEYGSEPFPALMRQYMGGMVPPQPRLQNTPGEPAGPQEEFRQMKEQAESELNSYGWVDRQAGIAHIPIDEAMKLLAEKHLGPKQEPQPPQAPDVSASR